MYRLFLILCFLSILGCLSNEPKTLIKEIPSVIDYDDFEVIEEKFQCEVDVPPQFLGGLTPKLPLAEIHSSRYTRSCLQIPGGLRRSCFNLVAKINDTLTLIDTQAKFRKVFAPIDNEEEAISYVAYLTQTSPKYDIPKKSRYRVYSSHFPSTFARRVSGGFEVLLHDKIVYGCGPKPNFYKIYRVTDAGEITLLQVVKMFEDPELDGQCVD